LAAIVQKSMMRMAGTPWLRAVGEKILLATMLDRPSMAGVIVVVGN
jgi:ATP-dependent protease Clp ATPase subunit